MSASIATTDHQNTFETANRKLEQFLYLHDIHHRGYHRNEDGLTVWEYPSTDEVMRVVEEFRAISKRRWQNASKAV